MRINALYPNEGFKKTPPRIPTFTCSYIPKMVQPVLPLVGGYLVGATTGIVLMDYLMRMSLLNQYYHDSIGVYKI